MAPAVPAEREPNRETSPPTPSGEGDAKDAALHSRPAPSGSPKNAGSIARRPRDFTSLSTIYCAGAILDSHRPSQYGPRGFRGRNYRDRKSTRLNSSHLGISYA